MKKRSAGKTVPEKRTRSASGGRAISPGPGSARSLARCRKIFDAMSDAVLVLDRKSRFTLVNRAGLRFLGLKARDVMGKGIADLPRSGDADAFAAIRAALGKRTAKTVSTPYDAGGRKGWCEVRLDPVPDGWVCVLRDFGAVPATDEPAAGRERLFLSLFDSLNDAVFIHEMHRDGGLRRLLRVNETACALLGRPRAEILAMSPADFMAPGTGFDMEEINRKLEAGETVAFENAVVTGDGRRVPVEVRIRPAALEDRRVAFVILRDISESKRAEQALVESEDKFRYVFENSIVPKSITFPDGRMQVNRAFCELLGYSREELETIPWRAITHPDDLALSEAAVARLLSGERDAARFAKRYVRQDGSVVWAEVSTRLRRSPDGTPRYFMTALNDVTESRRAAEALKASEVRFRSLFETSRDAIFLVASDTGDILAANDAACRLYGYTRDEFLRMKNTDISTEPEKTRASIGASEFLVPLRRHRGKDGGVFPVEITTSYFELDGKRLHTSYIRDITERRRLEERLEKDRREMRLIIDASPVRMFFKDRDGRFVRVNKAYLESLRRGEADIIGKTVFDLHAPDIARGMAADDREVFESGRPKLGIEEQYEAADGVRRLRTDKVPIFGDDGRVSGLIGFSLDVTDRKKAEEALLSSEKRFRALVENSSDAIYLIDRDGVIMYLGHSYEKVMGYRDEERLGKSTFELIHPDDQPAIRNLFAGIIERPGRVDLPPLRVRRADGVWRWIEGVAQNLLGDPDVGAVVVNFRDVTGRREAEEALKESEERFRLLAQNIPVLLNAYGPDGSFAYWNRECERVTGWSSAEIVGNRSAAALLYPDADYLERNMAEWEKSGKSFRNREMELTCKNGEKRCIAWTNISSDRKLPGWDSWAIGVDLTERKKSEEALSRSEQRFRAIIENSSDAISLIGFDGKVLYDSPSYERIMGYRNEDRMGKSPFDLIHPADKPALERLFAGLVDRPGRTDLPPTRVRRADGAWRWIEGVAQNLLADPAVGAVVVNFRDVTGRREAEDALRRSEERFRLMFQHSAAGIVIVGTDFRFQRTNPSFCRMIGYTEDELLSKTFQDVTHPDDRPLGAELVKATLAGERETFRLEKRYIRKDGTVIWGIVSSALVRDREGRPLHFVTQVQDITERREAEEALRKSEARFRDLAELLPQTIIEADAEGTLTYANRIAYETFGYPADILEKGIRVHELIVQDEWPRFFSVQKKIFAGERTPSGEYTARRRDGSTFPVLVRGVPIVVDGKVRGLRGMCVDISELKKLERELSEVRAILETAFMETPNAMILVTGSEGVIRMANRAAVELLGIRDEPDHVGEPAAGFSPSWQSFDPDGNPIPASDLPLDRALRGETVKSELQLIRRKDGSVRWGLASASPVRDAAGAIIAAFAVIPDVTGQIATGEELKKQLRVEQLAAEISADFVNVSFDQIDAAIKLALKKTTLYAGARLGSLFLVTPDGTTVTNTHEWCAAPEDSQFSAAPRPPVGIRAFHLASLNRNLALTVSRPADIPAGESEERDIADTYGFRPFALAPLFRGGGLIGAVGVYGESGREAEWPAQLVTLLGLIGDMIVNLLDRKQAETELDLYREHLEELVEQRTEELERSRAAAIKLMETATAQRERAEEAAGELSESQTRLRLATRSAQIGIVETDLESGTLIWDATCADIHGLSPETPVALERYLDELVHPEDRAAVRASLEAALASRAEHWRRELRIARPDGGRRWVTEDHVIIRGPGGEAVRLIGAKQDVTVQKEAEEQLRRALGEKETLIREIHHRVKNNLNTISNLIYFQTKLLKDRQAVAAFRDSQNRIQSMARIHEHLYRSWDLATVDMKAYLADLVVDLSQTYGVTTTRLDLDAGDLALDIDQAVPCGLIMNELVSNAMKYAFPQGGRNNRISVRLAAEGDGIVLEVADNGRGLPENWDLHGADTLGIRLVNMFCKQLAGGIAVKSEPGKGASFRIAFKRSKGGTAE